MSKVLAASPPHQIRRLAARRRYFHICPATWLQHQLREAALILLRNAPNQYSDGDEPDCLSEDRDARSMHTQSQVPARHQQRGHGTGDDAVNADRPSNPGTAHENHRPEHDRGGRGDDPEAGIRLIDAPGVIENRPPSLSRGRLRMENRMSTSRRLLRPYARPATS